MSGKNKKRRTSKLRQWEYILRRDDHRCGIHLGGCGKRFAPNERMDISLVNIGHIIPKAIRKPMPPTHLSEPDEPILYDGYAPTKAQAKIGGPQLVLAAKSINVQPMHVACNDAMQALYPPKWRHSSLSPYTTTLLSMCNCCQYIFLADGLSDKYRPVEWGDDDKLVEPILFMRYHRLNDMVIRMPFIFNGHWTSIGFKDGSRTPTAMTAFVFHNGIWTCGKGMGSAWTLTEMMQVNAAQMERNVVRKNDYGPKLTK